MSTDLTTISADVVGDITAAILGGEAASAEGWTFVADQHIRTSRWHERYYMVLRNEAGELWGVEYAEGLTESQESEYPWEDENLVPAVRLHPHEVTTTEYRTTPGGVA